MPIYDYICAACGRRFEVIHGVNDPAPEACPLCGSGPIRKAFAPPTIVFKGSGWAKKERRATAAPGKAASSGGERTGEGAGKPAADTSAAADSGSPGGEGAERASSATATPTDKAPAKTPSTASTDD